MSGVQIFSAPVGLLELVSDGGALVRAALVGAPRPERPDSVTRQAARELEEYFAGKRQEFTVALSPAGTPFQTAVWQALRRVPFGRVVTYGRLAEAIGHPTASRAVANALGKNSLLLFQPCHRVVASSGLGGFTGGLDVKRFLLRREGVEIRENTPFPEKFIFTFS